MSKIRNPASTWSRTLTSMWINTALATGRKEANMELYVHRNHKGLSGTGKLGGREFLYLTPTRHTVTTRLILH